MGNRINTIMQTCFFAISGVLPREQAIEAIKNAIRETYGKRGEAVVAKNFVAVDHTLSHLYQVTVPSAATSRLRILPPVPGARAGVRARCDSAHDRGSRRRSAGERDAGRRHFSDRHGHVGKAEYRASRFRSGMNSFAFSAGNAFWFVRMRSSGPRSTMLPCWAMRPQGFKCGKAALARIREPALHAAGLAGRLYGMRTLRRGLPGKEQERGQTQSH